MEAIKETIYLRPHSDTTARFFFSYLPYLRRNRQPPQGSNINFTAGRTSDMIYKTSLEDYYTPTKLYDGSRTEATRKP